MNNTAHNSGCQYQPYFRNWIEENNSNVERRIVSPYFKQGIQTPQKNQERLTCLQQLPLTPEAIDGHSFSGRAFGEANPGSYPIEYVSWPRIPQPCGGFWSIAVPMSQKDLYSTCGSEERNDKLGDALAPGYNPENEERWLNSPAGRTEEMLRAYGYPKVSPFGKMDPLIYYRR